jgi:GntR family transcriptional regulator
VGGARSYIGRTNPTGRYPSSTEELRVPTRTGSDGIAYRDLARSLRDALRDGRYGTNGRLPTEADLAASHGLSRQTVRRAMQDLVSEGLVYRVPGRGTFPTPSEGRYLRQFGSVEDLMALSLDTELQLLVPLARRIDLSAAGRLRLEDDAVWSTTFRRVHEGTPICVTHVSLPPDVGRLLSDVRELCEPGAVSRHTVLGLLDARLQDRVRDADQSITVAPVPAEAAAPLGTGEQQPVLRIDRLYSDSSRPVELAVSWFHPDHYSYRVRLRRSET